MCDLWGPRLLFIHHIYSALPCTFIYIKCIFISYIILFLFLRSLLPLLCYLCTKSFILLILFRFFFVSSFHCLQDAILIEISLKAHSTRKSTENIKIKIKKIMKMEKKKENQYSLKINHLCNKRHLFSWLCCCGLFLKQHHISYYIIFIFIFYLLKKRKERRRINICHGSA